MSTDNIMLFILGVVAGMLLFVVYGWWLRNKEVPRINRWTRAMAQEHFARWALEEVEARLGHWRAKYHPGERLSVIQLDERRAELAMEVLYEESNYVNPDEFRGNTSEGVDYGAQ